MTIGRMASSVIALALTGTGIGAILAPAASSRQYGLPVDEAAPLGLIRALGFRDLVFGLIAFRFLARGEKESLRDTVGIGSLVAAGDFVSVATARGFGPHLAIHAAGWLFMAGTYVLEGREREG